MENNSRKNKIQFIRAVIITGLIILLLGVILIYSGSNILDYIIYAYVLIATPLTIRYTVKEYGKEYTLYMLKQIGMLLFTILLGVASLVVYYILLYKVLNILNVNIQNEADLAYLAFIPTFIGLFIGVIYKTWVDKLEDKYRDLIDKVEKQCKEKKALIK